MKKKLTDRNQYSLFPPEIIQQTTQHHFWQHSVRTQLLYSSVLFSLIVALVMLPYLYVEVSVSSRGIIRPVSERKVLNSPVSGRITQWNVRENDSVSEGTLIAQIESPVLSERINFNRQRQEETERYLRDLARLVQLDSAAVINSHPQLNSALYNRSLTTFRQELRSLAIDLKNTRKLYERRQYLYDKEAISFAEVEESKYAFNSALSRYQLLYQRQLGEWEAGLVQYQQNLDKLKNEEFQLLKERHQYDIRMPVTGTIQNLAGLSEDSYVRVNQQLAEISPDTGLIAESYVSPRDVGLLEKGMEVRFQVDAFNYNRWGTLTGNIIDISNDAVIRNSQPFFRVRSVLGRPYLELPNGYKGYLKKGMTLQARFKVTERSLFQLLYDNVDDWLNPSRNDSREMA